MKKVHRFLSEVFLVSCFVYAQVPVPTTTVSLDEAARQLDCNQLTIHFIDIGPGLAILIQTPQNRENIFIDGGKWGLDGMIRYVKKFVPSTKIDLALVTHADTDHYEGMKKIFEQFQVKEFWYSGYDSEELKAAASWQTFLTAVAGEEGCVTHNPVSPWEKAGDTIIVDNRDTPSPDDDVKLVLLNADANTPQKDAISAREFDESHRRNNASLVFKLIYGKTSVLFAGDINGRAENPTEPNRIDSEELKLWVRHTFYGVSYNLTADILQVSHHGSSEASSPPLLKAVHPAYAVISAGHAYNHPRPDTLERLRLQGIKIIRTDEGDSTPEDNTVKDPVGDDNYIFQMDEKGITTLLKVKL